MSTQQVIELVLGAALIVGGILLYRRRGPDGRRGDSQSAVLMLVAGAILLVHGLSLLDYRPSPAEMERQ